MYHLTYVNSSAPSAVEYLTGTFDRVESSEARQLGLLAPLYRDQAKGLFLFSHHPRGRVWQVRERFRFVCSSFRVFLWKPLFEQMRCVKQMANTLGSMTCFSEKAANKPAIFGLLLVQSPSPP